LLDAVAGLGGDLEAAIAARYLVTTAGPAATAGRLGCLVEDLAAQSLGVEIEGVTHALEGEGEARVSGADPALGAGGLGPLTGILGSRARHERSDRFLDDRDQQCWNAGERRTAKANELDRQDDQVDQGLGIEPWDHLRPRARALVVSVEEGHLGVRCIRDTSETGPWIWEGTLHLSSPVARS
jgi:hypothetical protein